MCRLLIANLESSPAVGEALLEAASFADFDRGAVLARCEAHGGHLLTSALRLASTTEEVQYSGRGEHSRRRYSRRYSRSEHSPTMLQVARVLCLEAIDAETASTKVGGVAAAEGLAVVAALLRADTPRRCVGRSYVRQATQAVP